MKNRAKQLPKIHYLTIKILMKKILMKNLVIPFLVILGIIGCDGDSKQEGDSKQIREAQDILKNKLFDGKSAEFSDVKFYSATNYVCGLFNTKNILGHWDGAKRFIVSLNQENAYIDPDRTTPPLPNSPLLRSDAAVAIYRLESEEWKKRSDEIRKAGEIFDRLIILKCTNEPSKVTQLIQAPKIESKFVFDQGLTKIPIEFNGDDLSDIALKVADITETKDQVETTVEYNKRMSVISIDPSPKDFEQLYAVKFKTAPFDATDSITYDADRSKINIKYTGKLTDGFCRDRIPKHKEAHPVICYAGNGVYLSISNQSKFFLKNLVQSKNMALAAEYDFVDSFLLPRERISELPKVGQGFSNIGISTLLVGNIIKDQLNPSHSWVKQYSYGETIVEHAVSGNVIPFNVKYVIYYSSSSGEILLKKEF